MNTREYAALRTLWAGDWSGRFARLASGPRKGLKRFLWEYAEGRCVFCGSDVDEASSEVCHIFPGGRTRCGQVAGNLAIGCRKCNEIDLDSEIAFETIMRPEYIPSNWPEKKVLALLGESVRIQEWDEKQIIRRIRGM